MLTQTSHNEHTDVAIAMVKVGKQTNQMRERTHSGKAMGGPPPTPGAAAKWNPPLRLSLNHSSGRSR